MKFILGIAVLAALVGFCTLFVVQTDEEERDGIADQAKSFLAGCGIGFLTALGVVLFNQLVRVVTPDAIWLDQLGSLGGLIGIAVGFVTWAVVRSRLHSRALRVKALMAEKGLSRKMAKAEIFAEEFSKKRKI